MSQTSSNKKIIKNTLYLYTRQLVVIIISLYTSRVVLAALGFTDYGLYNVVGGVVVMFSFLNGAMRSSTQRFLNFQLGRNNTKEAHNVFCVSMMAFLLIMFLVIILSETIGLWFLNYKLNIPEGRAHAANWVFQFSLISFCISIIQVPYNATIIAYEKMDFYAYISIIEVALKLGIVYLLDKSGEDKLITYSFLLCLVTFLSLLMYIAYCRRSFTITKFSLVTKLSLFKKFLSFSSWSILGSIARICSNQGISIVLNLFCGVLLNAASGIAHQVSSKIYSFVSNFQVAFNPQITKRYASRQYEGMFDLIYVSSKISYFLLFIIAIPIIHNCDYILHLWLNNVPDYAVEFTSLSIIFLLVDCLQAPLWMTIQATGRIRKYQVVVSFIILLNLPVIYFCLYLGMSPISVWIVRIVIDIFLYIIRIIFVKYYVDMDVRDYLKSVVIPIGVVSILSIFFCLVLKFPNSSILDFFLSSLAYFLSTSLCVFLFGLNAEEKHIIYTKILKK